MFDNACELVLIFFGGKANPIVSLCRPLTTGPNFAPGGQSGSVRDTVWPSNWKLADWVLDEMDDRFDR